MILLFQTEYQKSDCIANSLAKMGLMESSTSTKKMVMDSEVHHHPLAWQPPFPGEEHKYQGDIEER